MLDGTSIRPGDVVLGLGSSGLHTNGYSLARQILFEKMRLKPSSRLPELSGSVGDELLKIHVSYGPLVQKLLKKFNAASVGSIKGLAHITGGGFVDNIPRVLPRNCDVVIRKRSWEVLPIFQILQRGGNVPEAELYQVFNMGIGMILIVSKPKAEAILRFASAQKHPAWLIGEVVKGRGRVRVVS
jgi:phosphoribosylformylglycinamidine cyclo-ligase